MKARLTSHREETDTRLHLGGGAPSGSCPHAAGVECTRRASQTTLPWRPCGQTLFSSQRTSGRSPVGGGGGPFDMPSLFSASNMKALLREQRSPRVQRRRGLVFSGVQGDADDACARAMVPRCGRAQGAPASLPRLQLVGKVVCQRVCAARPGDLQTAANVRDAARHAGPSAQSRARWEVWMCM